jgi:hypothetical protein
MSKYLINPRIEIQVFSDVTFIISDEHIEYNIEKDLSENPNEADITIHNLSPSTRAKLSNSTIQSTPLVVYLTAAGKTNLIPAYRGEIDIVNSNRSHPGYETNIHCFSQKSNHRSFYFEPKTYTKGTPGTQIVNDLVKSIGLPSQINQSVLPTQPILMAQTFSGPAFPLLERFCLDHGCYCYIIDGILVISSIYLPNLTEVKQIKKTLMLETPSFTTRNDASLVEMHTTTEMITVDPFSIGKNKKKKRKEKIYNKLVVDENAGETKDKDYVEYEAIDKTINGLNFSLLCQPDIQPDDLVSLVDHVDYIGKTYRVQKVNHHGDNFGGDWTTDIETDDVDGGILEEEEL